MVMHGGVVVAVPSMQVVINIGGECPWVMGEGGTSSMHGWWGLASLMWVVVDVGGSTMGWLLCC